MHRNRILALARAAVPESARTYTGHIAPMRFREGMACPNCNATKNLAVTEILTYRGERLDWNAYPPPPPGDIVKVVALSCPNCATFTAMEVQS